MHTKLSTASILCSTEFQLPYKLCQHKTFIQGKMDTNRGKENGLKERIERMWQKMYMRN